MRVNPAIAALRSDHTPQRQAQQAMKAAWDGWKESDDVASALSEFVKMGDGTPLEKCPSLEEIFTGQGKAEELTSALISHFSKAISGNPLGQPPFRNGYDGKSSTLLLAKSGSAQLLLQSREPGEYAQPCANYIHSLRYDATLAGRADATIARTYGSKEQVEFHDEAVALRAGVRLAFDCSSEALLVERVEKRLVTLRLLQGAKRPEPGREYCRKTGELLHQSAGSLATSRREMMVALLGRMERAEAAPTFSQIATQGEDDSLRWQAVRECLALDTVEGFTTLCNLSRDSVDPLADTAGALRAQLIEAHPQLRALENQ